MIEARKCRVQGCLVFNMAGQQGPCQMSCHNWGMGGYPRILTAKEALEGVCGHCGHALEPAAAPVETKPA
jgi:hypothetical protein